MWWWIPASTSYVQNGAGIPQYTAEILFKVIDATQTILDRYIDIYMIMNLFKHNDFWTSPGNEGFQDDEMCCYPIIAFQGEVLVF